jgi:hypothetical protein
MSKETTKEKIIDEYKKVESKLGHQPSAKLFYLHTNFHSRDLVRVFGRGGTPNSFQSPKSDLDGILQSYGKLVRKLGYKPIEDEWNLEGLIPTVSGIRASHGLKWSEVAKKFTERYSESIEWNDVLDILLPNREVNSETHQTPLAPQSCFVYLMLDKRTMFHKIGISNAAEYREKTLQSEQPQIILLAKKEYPNRRIAASIEKALHSTYEHKRKRGEWFLLDEGDVNELVQTLDD